MESKEHIDGTQTVVMNNGFYFRQENAQRALLLNDN